MSKSKCICYVRESAKLAPGVYSLWLEAPQIAAQARAGQFVSLYCRDRDRLLPRPISICEINRDEGLLRLVYRVAGAGTEEFSELTAGDGVEVLGPLGNGFPTEGSRPLLIGGGIGIPPMLQLARSLTERSSGGSSAGITAVLGYRDSQLFLKEEFEACARVEIATDDGSVGTRGTVIDAVMEKGLCGASDGVAPVDVIYACGPVPMLRGVKKFGLEQGIPVYLSMEERMACGVGACLGCVCQSVEVDSHSKVRNKRVCKDGPVFLSTDINLDGI